MPLSPDKVETWNGLKVNKYFINEHNVNGIDLPSRKMTPMGITVHNTGAISVASSTTMAEQYTRATVNGAMGDVRVHFYVDPTCVWWNLPLDNNSWHAGDGNGDGNARTISIEIIGDTSKAEENGIKLVAYLMNKFNFTIDKVFPHQHWNGKYCPAYILPHWDRFKANVVAELNKLKGSNGASAGAAVPELYRVRKTWEDAKSQIGAYANLENAKSSCKEGYSVFDSKGKAVYTKGGTVTPTPTPSTPASEPAKPSVEKPDIIYRVYSGGKWNSEITNCNDVNSMGYAGLQSYAICGVAAKVTSGSIRYRVHVKNGGWLGWITKYDINDWYNGYAGLTAQSVDGVQIELLDVPGYQVRYRVCNISTGQYYPWVLGLEDYAGLFGKQINKLQMEIVKV